MVWHGAESARGAVGRAATKRHSGTHPEQSTSTRHTNGKVTGSRSDSVSVGRKRERLPGTQKQAEPLAGAYVVAKSGGG
jgi:hypothetical protein